MSTEPPTTKQLFQAMFYDTPVVPAEVHRAAWRYTQTERAIDLAKMLVARLDAPADLVAEYAALTAPELRNVYLARPEVGEDQVASAIAGERRASVLLDALNRNGHVPEVVAEAVTAFLEKPTKTLVDRMRELPEAQRTPRLADAVLTVYSARDVTEAAPGLTPMLGHLGRDRARAWLPRLENPTLVAQLICYDVGDDLAGQTAVRVLTQMLAPGNPFNSHHRSWLALDLTRAALAGRRSDDGLRARLLEVLGHAADTDLSAAIATVVNQNRPEPHTPWPDGAGDETRTEAPTGPGRAPGTAVAAVASADPSALVELAHSSDPAVVASVADRLPGINPNDTGWSRIAGALLGNPALTVADRHRIMRAVRMAVEPRLGHLDAISLFRGDDLVRETWCAQFPHQVLSQHGWEPFGGVAQSARLVPEWAAKRNDTRFAVAVTHALQAGVPDEVVLTVPMEMILALWTTPGGRTKAAPLMARVATRHIADRLGDQADAWALFNRLQGAFTGTLGELLNTCCAAAA